MKYEVETWYKDHLLDFVKYAEAYGACGERVDRPNDIKPALERAVRLNKTAVIEIIVERETDASMGTQLDAILEYEALADEKIPAESALM